MARARVHDEDTVLDAARAVILSGGVRGATISTISAGSGAPSGSIYHWFDSRQGVLAAVWRRATTRSQALWLEAEAVHHDDAVSAGTAMALSQLQLARSHPDDVRVLTVLRPEDFPEIELDIGAHNKPVREALRRVARGLQGPDTAVRAQLATIDLPYGVLQVRLGADHALPEGLDRYLEAAARVVLTDPRPGEVAA